MGAWKKVCLETECESNQKFFFRISIFFLEALENLHSEVPIKSDAKYSPVKKTQQLHSPASWWQPGNKSKG